MELFLTKNTKNGMEQDVTILYKKHQEWNGTEHGERTNEKLLILQKVLILEQSRTISKKLERAQPYFSLINDKLKGETFVSLK